LLAAGGWIRHYLAEMGALGGKFFPPQFLQLAPATGIITNDYIHVNCAFVFLKVD